MTAIEVAQHLNGRKTGRGKWIARCTAHQDRRPSLVIAEGKTGVLLSCMSHQCDFLDIVKGAGLKPLMLRYDYVPNVPADRQAIAEAQRRRTAQEAASWRDLVRQYVQMYRDEDYKTYGDDLAVTAAVSQIMAVEGEKPHLQKMLRTAMARITAYAVCVKADERNTQHGR